MGRKGKIETHASTEAMRWADDGVESKVHQGPGEDGNIFDIRMRDEADGVLAAKKIVSSIKEKGLCLCEANAPQQLLEAAYYEATELWEDGAFTPPMRVHDDRSMLEAQLWNQALKDEEKVVWIRDGGAKPAQGMNALKLLAKNMADFCGGLGELLRKDLNIEFDRIGHAMLSCYTGDRQYNLHLDNPHGEEEDEGLPDNGIRLTATYYINPHWDPAEGCNGGLDMFLTDPKETPSSGSDAKKANKLRIAPHADTLVMFLSERMAHQIVPTKGKDTKWFALHLWCLNGAAMQSMSRKLVAMRNKANKDDSDDD